MKRKILISLALTCIFLILPVHSAIASTATWEPVIETAYDLSFPGTILVYKDELNQGGLNLVENKITPDKSETDLVFENDVSPDMAARGVLDLGTVNFDTVTSIPDDGYNTVVTAKAGHVYLVLTHDNNFAKVMVKSIIGQRVMLKYSLVDQIVSNPSNETGGQNNSSNGSGINNSVNNTVIDNSVNNTVIDNSVNNTVIDNSVNNQLIDNS